MHNGCLYYRNTLDTTPVSIGIAQLEKILHDQKNNGFECHRIKSKLMINNIKLNLEEKLKDLININEEDILLKYLLQELKIGSDRQEYEIIIARYLMINNGKLLCTINEEECPPRNFDFKLRDYFNKYIKSINNQWKINFDKCGLFKELLYDVDANHESELLINPGYYILVGYLNSNKMDGYTRLVNDQKQTSIPLFIQIKTESKTISWSKFQKIIQGLTWESFTKKTKSIQDYIDLCKEKKENVARVVISKSGFSMRVYNSVAEYNFTNIGIENPIYLMTFPESMWKYFNFLAPNKHVKDLSKNVENNKLSDIEFLKDEVHLASGSFIGKMRKDRSFDDYYENRETKIKYTTGDIRSFFK